MKRWRFGAAAFLLLLAGLGMWLGKSGGGMSGGDSETSAGTTGLTAGGSEPGDGEISRPTKVSVRPSGTAGATHSPARLREFYLPPVEIDGMSLAAAVEKLRESYVAACLQSGEVPVALTFAIPSGVDGLIHLNLRTGTLDGSLRILAAISGLRIRRDGAVYRFEEVGENRIAASKELHAPPDLLARLAEMAGRDFPDGAGLRERLEALGVELDSGTRLSFNPAWGMVQLEAATAADQAGVSALLKVLGSETPVQHVLKTKVVRLSAGTEWQAPDVSQVNDAELQLVIRELAQIKGCDLLTAPSVTARGGEDAKIELTRELIVPIAGDGFEVHNVGLVFDYTMNPLGFGHALDMTFTDTSGEIDPAEGGVEITENARIEESGFASDHHTRLQVQDHPDGSRTVLLVSPTLVDATGRPLRPAD